MQKIGEAKPKHCIHCTSSVHKLISQSSFQLKGTGWYATDYAKMKETKSGEKPTTEKCETPKTGENKSTNQKAA